MRAAVIVFPGSNCDRDATTVLQHVVGKAQVQAVWHAEGTLPKVDLVVVPGGFSYGDYLRSGAMAAHSPIMKEVVTHAQRGGLVLGICNGFQILTEAGLLPGVLMRNRNLKFLCRDVWLRVETTAAPFCRLYKKNQVLRIPIAHMDGNYTLAPDALAALEQNDQIAFRYCDEQGQLTEQANPNGSLASIAGVFNTEKNVLGMMPHPERHSEDLLGGSDGRILFESLKSLAA